MFTKIRHVYNKIEKYIVFIIALIMILIAALAFINSINYELKHAYTSDAPMYWTVGRGILNGIKPYTGLYENKPIGIFALSALSFALCDDTIICNYFTLAFLLIIAIGPLVSILLILKDKSKKLTSSDYIYAVIALFFGIMLMIYSEERAGAFQVESLASGAVIGYLCSINAINDDSKKYKINNIIWSICATLFLIFAALLKEPFVIVALSASLLFVDNIKSFVNRVLSIFIYSGLGVFLIYLLSGWLKGYVSIYFSYMLSQKIEGNNSALLRAFDLGRIFEDVYFFNGLLAISILIALAVCFLSRSKDCKEYTDKSGFYGLYHILRIAFAVYTIGFTVGMGGQYYDHHHICAVPIYFALIVFALKELIIKDNVYFKYLFIVLSIAMIFILCKNRNREFFGDYTQRYEEIKNKADYVDRLMDYYGESRYQYLGFNGEKAFYGLTEHLPMGPEFCQDWDNYNNSGMFLNNLVKQVNSVNIVILDYYSTDLIRERIEPVLLRDFTENPSDVYNFKKPEDFNYKIYFRKSIFE